MSNIVLDKLLLNVGPTKHTNIGWTSFNGKCCIHNGDTRNDTRKRAGVHPTEDDGFIYHCFNCGFKAGWKPGIKLSYKIKNLLSWYNVSEDDIKKINFKVYQLKLQVDNNVKEVKEEHEEYTFLNFKEISLPEKSKPLMKCFDEDFNDKNFINVVEYLLSRGEYLAEFGEFYWANTNLHNLTHRLLIPCKWNNKIVGWTARSVNNHKYKYMSEIPSDYLFNTESIKEENEFIFVCEGPFDALAINGIATLGDKMSYKQINWLNQQNKKIVIVPDRENQGGKLVDIAIHNKWYVSFPEWDDDVKDSADATKKYGVLYTVWSLLNNIVKDTNSIKTKRTKLRRLNGRK